MFVLIVENKHSRILSWEYDNEEPVVRTRCVLDYLILLMLMNFLGFNYSCLTSLRAFFKGARHRSSEIFKCLEWDLSGNEVAEPHLKEQFRTTDFWSLFCL